MHLSIHNSAGEILWLNVGLLAFAIIFFIAGASRVTEVTELNFPKWRKLLLITIHLLGTFCFSTSLIFLMLDEAPDYRPYANALFLVAIFSLFPLHIYLALKRKIRDDHGV